MAKFGRRIKKALKKAGRAMGGPITGSVDAGKAIKRGKGGKAALKAFGRATKPGASIQEAHSAHVELAAGTTEAAFGRKAAGRIEDLGRVTKPAIPDTEGPIRDIEALGSAGKAAVKGNWRRAGRSMGRVLGQSPVNMLTNAVEAGQATGDFFDTPTQRLDERLKPMLRRIFGDGIKYDDIRTKSGRPGWGSDTSATTFPSIIYLGDGRQQFVDDGTGNPVMITLTPEGNVAQPDNVFVHELVHVWQSQNGGDNYLPEAVFSYAVHGEDESYYWWNFTEYNKDMRATNPRSARNQGKKWRNMPPEAQAEFIQHAYMAGAFGGDRASASYLQFQLASTTPIFDADARANYQAAFGTGVTIDWTDLLKGAVQALDKGDFRY